MQDLQKAITAFETSTKPGVWPHIPKKALLDDIRQTTANPYKVDQGQTTPLCGPAAIVFELVSRHAARYVKLCQALYETGEFQGRTKRIRPSNTLKNSKVRSGVSPADWLLLATLRDTENAIFDVEETSGQIAMGVTTPWEMKGWTLELLGYNRVEYEPTYLYGEFDALRKADAVRNSGGVAFLMIHSAMLGNPAPSVGYPDHWVSYMGGLHIDEGKWWIWDSGHVRFDCYSWGGNHRIDQGEGPFEDYMWGVVTGQN